MLFLPRIKTLHGLICQPVSGAVIAAGGGISIAGDPYIGLNGRRKDPDSGKLLVDWTT